MIYAVVGSVTTAGRLAKKLSAATGSPVRVIHTPAEMNQGGCSYAIKTPFGNTEPIRKIAEEYGIHIRQYFIEETKTGKKGYHVIS